MDNSATMDSGISSDVILISEDGKQFPCNRSLLAKESDYFQAMFAGDFSEKNKTSITIKDVDGFYLEAVVNSTYGHFPILDFESACNLLEVSSMMQMKSLNKRLVTFLKEKLSVSTALQILELSDSLGLMDLKAYSLPLVLHHFDKFCLRKNDMIRLEFGLLKRIIAHKGLNCNNEIELINLIDAWSTEWRSNCTTKIHEERILNLLECVAFRFLNLNDLKSITELALFQDPTLADVLQALLRHLDSNKDFECPCCEHSAQFSCFACRKCQESRSCPIDKKSLCCSSTEECSQHRQQRKKRKIEAVADDIESPRSNKDAVSETLARRLLSDGGSREQVFLTCFVALGSGPTVFTFQFNQPRPLVRLEPIIREDELDISGFQVCCVGTDIYVIGGEYGLGRSLWQKVVWKYDTLNASWSSESEINPVRRHHSLCVVDHFIYVIGGVTKHRVVMDRVDRYNTLNHTWERCPSIPTTSYSVACCSYRSTIYVFGLGFSVYALDCSSADSHWKVVASLIGTNRLCALSVSKAISVPKLGIYLQSGTCNGLYFFDPDGFFSGDLAVVGNWKSNNIREQGTCFTRCRHSGFLLHSFFTLETPESKCVVEAMKVGSSSCDPVESQVVWTQDEGNNFMGFIHSFGSFPLLKYEFN